MYPRVGSAFPTVGSRRHDTFNVSPSSTSTATTPPGTPQSDALMRTLMDRCVLLPMRPPAAGGVFPSAAGGASLSPRSFGASGTDISTPLTGRSRAGSERLSTLRGLPPHPAALKPIPSEAQTREKITGMLGENAFYQFLLDAELPPPPACAEESDVEEGELRAEAKFVTDVPMAVRMATGHVCNALNICFTQAPSPVHLYPIFIAYLRTALRGNPGVHDLPDAVFIEFFEQVVLMAKDMDYHSGSFIEVPQSLLLSRFKGLLHLSGDSQECGRLDPFVKLELDPLYRELQTMFARRELGLAAEFAAEVKSPVEQLRTRIGHAMNVIHICARESILHSIFTSTLVAYVAEAAVHASGGVPARVPSEAMLRAFFERVQVLAMNESFPAVRGFLGLPAAALDEYGPLTALVQLYLVPMEEMDGKMVRSARLINFQGSYVAGHEFVDVHFDGCRFHGADARGSRFIGCSMARTRWDRARVDRADFSRSQGVDTLGGVGAADFSRAEGFCFRTTMDIMLYADVSDLALGSTLAVEAYQRNLQSDRLSLGAVAAMLRADAHISLSVDEIESWLIAFAVRAKSNDAFLTYVRDPRCPLNAVSGYRAGVEVEFQADNERVADMIGVVAPLLRRGPLLYFAYYLPALRQAYRQDIADGIALDAVASLPTIYTSDAIPMSNIPVFDIVAGLEYLQTASAAPFPAGARRLNAVFAHLQEKLIKFLGDLPIGEVADHPLEEAAEKLRALRSELALSDDTSFLSLVGWIAGFRTSYLFYNIVIVLSDPRRETLLSELKVIPEVRQRLVGKAEGEVDISGLAKGVLAKAPVGGGDFVSREVVELGAPEASMLYWLRSVSDPNVRRTLSLGSLATGAVVKFS